MAFWMLLAVMAFTYVVGQLLQPKPKDADPANLGDILPPDASKGRPIPVIFGTQKVAPNVIWWGNVHADAITERVKTSIFNTGKHVIIGYQYGADIAGAFCHGPIDELLDFQFEDTSMRDYASKPGSIDPSETTMVQDGNGNWVLIPPMYPSIPVTNPGGAGTPLNFRVKAPNMFGGQQQQGGVEGRLEFFWGQDPQPASANLAAKSGMGSILSNYKGLVYFFMYNATFGTSPNMKPFYAILRRCPKTVSPDVPTSNINGSANPADVLYEVLTNEKWGLGKPTGAFDLASFTAAAVTLKAEDMGVDFTLNAQDSAESICGDVLRHIDGVLFTHPQTGLITLKLARADYVVGTLLHADTTNIIALSEYKRSTWPETFNEVKINYIERGSGHTLPPVTTGYKPYLFREDTQQAQNLASLQAMGEVASTTLDFKYFSRPNLAQMAAFRTLRVVSLPLVSMTLTVNRKFAVQTIGSCLVVDWAPLGITGMVVRIVNMKAGLLTDNTVELQVIEDVFNTAPTTFTPVPGSVWVPPTTLPAAPITALAIPSPYFLVKADAFVGINMVARGSKAVTQWDGHFDLPATSDATPGPMYTEDNPFVPVGTLVAPLLWSGLYQDSGIILNDLQDLDKIYSATAAGYQNGESLAMIYGGVPGTGELVAFRDVVSNADGTYTLNVVMRGQMDTVPRDHPAGAKVYFFTTQALATYWPGWAPVGVPPTASSQTPATSGYKGWAASKSPSGRRAPEPPTFVISQTGIAITDPRRAVMPYPPGHLRLNGTEGNAINVATPIAGGSVSIAWDGRNRLTETTMRQHSAAGVAPEAGTLYRATVLWVNRATGATIYTLRTDDPVTTPYVYTNTMLEWDFMEANGGVALPGGAANRTNGGLRVLIQAYTSATLKSLPVATPGFSDSQAAGYPVVPSVIYSAAATLPSLADVTDLYAWYSAAPDGPNVYAGVEPLRTVTTLGDKIGGQNSAITGTVTRPRNIINRLPAFDFGAVGPNYGANVSIPLKGGLTWFGVMKYSAAGIIQMLFDAFPTGTPMNLYIDALDKLTNSIAGAGSSQAGAWITVVAHLTQVNPTTANFKLRVNGATIINTNFGAGTSAIVATGGTVTTAGGYTIHTFTGSGSFVVTGAGSGLEALVVGGGGGGGWGSGQRSGGGGGGGRVVEVPAGPISAGTFPVVVGAGGTPNVNGGNSTFNGQTAPGGGQGGGSGGSGVNGGSGGGARHGGFSAGAAVAGSPVAGSGMAGGPGGYDSGSGTGVFTGSGGGGAAQAGAQGISTVGGKGGDGIASLMSGVSTLYGAGGGGAAGNFGGQTVDGGLGGAGGGGKGGQGLGTGGGTGTPGTGGNATGIGCGGGGGSNDGTSGSGTAGIVIIRYPTTGGGGAVPGTPGSPVTQLFNLFNKGGATPFKGLIAEHGIYAQSRDGSEAVLEAYLRSKYGTW